MTSLDKFHQVVFGRHGLWPSWFVAIMDCGRYGLWPSWFVAIIVETPAYYYDYYDTIRYMI